MSNRRIIINSLTYQSMVDEFKLITSKLLPDWNVDDENDVGVYLAELSAAFTEKHNVFSNDLALEARSILDAVDVNSVKLQAFNQLYRQRTAQPCRVLVRIDLISLPTSSINVVAYEMKVSTKGSTITKNYFENTVAFTVSNSGSNYVSNYTDTDGVLKAVTSTSVIFTPGSYKYSVVVNGSVITKYFVVQEFTEGQSKVYQFYHNGLDFSGDYISDQNIIINEVPGIYSNYGIDVVYNGDHYELVDTFAYGLITDKIFMLSPSIDGTWYASFPDGNLGIKPDSNGQITVSYRVGGGLNIVDINQVTVSETVPVTLSVVLDKFYNESQSYGGKDIESVDYMRRSVPMLGGRYSKLDDLIKIEYVVTNLDGVARSRISNIGTLINIVIIPNSGSVPNQSILNDVEDAVLARLSIGWGVNVYAPNYLAIAITISYKAKTGYTNVEIQSDLSTIIYNLIDPLAIDDNGLWVNNLNDSLTGEDIGTAIKSCNKIFDYTATLNGVDIMLASCKVLLSSNQVFDKDKSTLVITAV